MPMLRTGHCAKARMWVYAGDEAHPYNVFDFTLNRGRDGPKYFLKNYNQVLLADAYGGYDGLVAGNGIVRAGCWAHLRRKIIDAEKAAPEIARQAITMVSALYCIEKQGRNAAVEERRKLREEQSTQVLAELREKLFDWKEQLLPKHPMSEAVNYAVGHWEELNVFLADGAVPIDNNVSEREMKRVVLNRKNSLFVGNARAGHTASILTSLTSTCRRHDVDPQLYLTQLLVNLPTIRISDLRDWLPDRWNASQKARVPVLENQPPTA
jgi:transposase